VIRQAGPDVFRSAGVPGVQDSGRFASGGIVPSGSGELMIENITIVNNLGVGKSTAEAIVTFGLNGEKGRAATVNNVKVARTNREL